MAATIKPAQTMQPASRSSCVSTITAAPSRSTTTGTSSSSSPARLTAREIFDATCSILGGLNTTHFRGYVGTWTHFSHQANDSSSSSSSAAQPPPSPPTSCPYLFVDETLNFRLFQLEEPSTATIHQVNLYQQPGPAAASYKPYISNAAAARPDGYTLRDWRYTPQAALYSPDGSPWRTMDGTAAAERTLMALAVADRSIALINGALPASFDAQQPTSWFMEVIFKEPGSDARRWAILHRYDAGQLYSTKAINEDHFELPADLLDSYCIDPSAIKLLPRKTGPMGDVDSWAAGHPQQQQQQQPCISPIGTATRFTWDTECQLTVQTMPCTWSNSHRKAAVPDASNHHHSQQSVAVLQHPDWSYSRVPVDIPTALAAAEAAAAAAPQAGPAGVDLACVVFELGTVLPSGAVARWLLQYQAGGHRLLQTATYELYAAAAAADTNTTASN